MNKYIHAGKKMKVKKGAGKSLTGELLDDKEFVAEDYWINVAGESLWDCDGNPACIEYALRTTFNKYHIPIDDNVVYGKVGLYGHLFHETELELIAQTDEQPEETVSKKRRKYRL